MIRIIHLSDFHLNKLNLKDWNTYIKSAFVKKIKSLNDEKRVDFIACTGTFLIKEDLILNL